MNPVLPDARAKDICLGMIDSFIETGFIDYDGERLVPTQSLFRKGHGRMFGVLVTYEGAIIKAFSGALEGRWRLKPFAEPAFDLDAYESVLAECKEPLSLLTERINSGESGLEEQRRRISEDCWDRLSKLYRFNCFDGQQRILAQMLPHAPSGTGDCCAPKLLSQAYAMGQRPSYMAEFFFGDGPFPSGQFTAPCDARCRPLLKHIIGLDIIYQDKEIVVVNKPEGLLSIPGKGPDKADCAASRTRGFFQHCIPQPCVHRLDQDTSGLMVLGLTAQAHDRLSMDFERRAVRKEYMALVEGVIKEERGTIELPMRSDPEHRPHQIVDMEKGKKAVTRWERMRVEPYCGRNVTRLRLVPATGRTHQLRVHCAAGLGCPIVGDALYGTPDRRLMLQACLLEFNHPASGEIMSFSLDEDF